MEADAVGRSLPLSSVDGILDALSRQRKIAQPPAGGIHGLTYHHPHLRPARSTRRVEFDDPRLDDDPQLRA
jgi:hypothetical protein